LGYQQRGQPQRFSRTQDPSSRAATEDAKSRRSRFRALGIDQSSAKVKSGLGCGFTAIVGTGSYRDYLEDGEQDTSHFWFEV